MSVDDDVTRLYSLPLEQFTAERNALAKRLRADGDRDGAGAVKKLKKPSLPAWAINQAVGSEPAAAKALVEAGERLDEAQTSALEGGGAAALREAMTGQQTAVERMMEAVEAALGDKSSGAVLDRARETLRAVAGDDELRAEFSAGRVTRDREAVGFGGAPAAPRRRAKTQKSKQSADDARLRDAHRAEKRAARQLEGAAKRVAAAERRLDRAQEAVDAAQADRDVAERDRAERESELADARSVIAELRG